MTLPFLMSEGQHLDHFGNLVWPVYVDFRHPEDREPISTLVKGCQAQFAMEAVGRLRISKPSGYREFGEHLIGDRNEARPLRSTETVIHETIDDPGDLVRARQRDQALNKASQLVGAGLKTETTSVRKTHSEGESRSLEAGKGKWVFCTSIEPSTACEWEQWRKALDDDYDHVSYIHRPRTFARELGSIAVEHLGPRSQVASLSHSFEGLPTLNTDHPAQWILHGPVIYVDDVYDLVEAAKSQFEFTLLPLFAKHKRYAAQREYRFVIVSETEPGELFQDLPVSPGMAGIIGEGKSDIPLQWMPDSAVTKQDLAPPESNAGNRDYTSSDEGDDYGLGRRLLNSDSLEAELFRTFTQANNPATVYKPHEINTEDLPDDFRATTATYSGVKALHSKVGDFLRIDEESSERRLGVTSAAWYAEHDIRALCQEFDDPVAGISLSPGGYIVIHIALSDWPEVEGKLTVAPTGESVLRLVAPRRHLISPREHRLPRKNIAQDVRKYIDQLGRDAAARRIDPTVREFP